ncbi:hypothetical protein Patl1_34421 [Pistacia atlantica]|uniref:Uncharacterized protein n=1 Tax=Pistacia atlantica TaxID=434234 RepID=A0ACC0ZUD2_9ROSI|nr:hypothetical protein Patl1_34421 [Pistacia atlantica]
MWRGVAFAQHILFIPKFGRFDNLHDLYINNCLIKDLACLRYATRLRFVFAKNCPLLEEIIPYEFSSSSGDLNMFKNLKQLNFLDLPLLKSICRVMHFPSLERIWVFGCQSLTQLPLDLLRENNSRISIFGHQEWWDKLEWENSSSKVSYPSMHQTAPVSGLAAQSWSYNFSHFPDVDLMLSDMPSYTYEATKLVDVHLAGNKFFENIHEEGTQNEPSNTLPLPMVLQPAVLPFPVTEVAEMKAEMQLMQVKQKKFEDSIG